MIYKRSNCLFFAFALAARRRKKYGKGAGYISTRWSYWGPFPHFLYTYRGTRTNTIRMVAYVPLDPRKRRFPPPYFLGQVRWGDPPPPDENPHQSRA